MPAAASASLLAELLTTRPDQIRLRAGAPSGAGALKIDSAAGTIAGVSLLTANMQAKGWPFFIDAKTITMMAALLQGRRLKGYATHGAWGADGTLDEIGYWEGAAVDGTQLRAGFVALAAWKKFKEAEFATLFELAEKLPAEFGASLHYRHDMVWVREGGEEIKTRITGWDYENDRPRFDPSAPADAAQEWPSSRPLEVYSADFVDNPGGNDNGLLRSGVDARGKDVASASPSPASTSPDLTMISFATLHAKFGSNPVRLAAAISLVAANDKLEIAEIETRLAAQEQSEEIVTLRKFKADHEPELATLRGLKTTSEAEAAKLKAAGFEPKDGKTAVDAALAEVARLKANNTALASGGAPLVDTGAPGGGDAAAAGSRDEQMTKLREEMEKITGNEPAALEKRANLAAKLRELRWGPEKK